MSFRVALMIALGETMPPGISVHPTSCMPIGFSSLTSIPEAGPFVLMQYRGRQYAKALFGHKDIFVPIRQWSLILLVFMVDIRGEQSCCGRLQVMVLHISGKQLASSASLRIC